MTYLVLGGIAFLLNFIANRRKVIEYEVIASAIYLIAFIFIQSFDILFVLYIVFFTLPYIRGLQKMQRGVFIAVIYIIAKLSIAFFHESTFTVLATFLTRYFPIIFLAMINLERTINAERRTKDELEQKILRLVVFFELLISVILYTQHNSDIFVVSHQPVGANLSLIGIYLVMDISLMKKEIVKKYKIENFIYSFIFMALALISGIRGYIIIVFPCALFSIVNYVFGEKKRKVGLIMSVMLAITIFFLGFVGSTYLRNLIYSLDMSIGYRTIENQYFWKLMKDSNPFRWIFGYWIGATGSSISSSTTISLLANGSNFYYMHLMSGPTLLNYWYTVTKDMGLVGLGIYIWFYILLGKRDNRNIEGSRKPGLFLYLVLYAFMLMYRMSCTNGLLELYIVYAVSCSNFSINQ